MPISWSVYWAYAIGTQAPVAPRFRLATVSRMIGGSCDRLRAGFPSATLVVYPADRKVGRPFSGKHAQYGHNLIVKFSRRSFQGGLANTRESPISRITLSPIIRASLLLICSSSSPMPAARTHKDTTTPANDEEQYAENSKRK